MARSMVQPETINRSAYEALRAADMSEDQAKAVAAHLPDWSRFATRQDLAELESRLIRWMVGIFLAIASLLAAAVSVLVAVLG